MGRLKRFVWLASFAFAGFMLWANAASAQEASPDISSEVRQDGDFISVSAMAELPVPRKLAFAVLTDYDRFTQFIPDLDSSRVALRQGSGIILEQKGTMRFLFFSQPVDVMLAVIESFPDRIVSRALGGNLRGFSGKYELQDTPDGGTRIVYSARFIPAFVLPEFIGTFIVRSVFVKNFGVMLREMQRRQTAAAGFGPGASAAAAK